MASMNAPVIPSRVSSLRHCLGPKHEEALVAINKRKASISSLYGSAQSTEEFITTKVEELQIDIEYCIAFERGMHGAWKLGAISKEEFDEGIREMSRNAKAPKQREIAILRRQKRRIIEELEEITLTTNDNGLDIPEQAYIHMMVKKIMSSTGHQKKAKQFDASKFKKDVLSYYSATRSAHNTTQAYCQLTGCWVDPDDVRAAHIVPKSLDAHEIRYLFGEGENPSTNPKNALVLLSKLEQGMDAGVICFVPEAGKNGAETKWVCLLTEESKRNQTYSARIKWGEVDGKCLTFVGPGRPAARYLYFRYVTTYLHHKNNGNIAWALKNKSKDSMWPTPGPWIRKSMICVLARAASDYFLPDAVIEEEIEGTFATSDDIAMRPAVEEHDAAISMSMALEADMTLARKGVNGELSDESDDDDDDDGYEDEDDKEDQEEEKDHDKVVDDAGDEQEANKDEVTTSSSSETDLLLN